MDSCFSLTRLDGRNSHLVSELAEIFCDYSTTKMRVKYELDFLTSLNEYINRELVEFNEIVDKFSLSDYNEIKEIERKAGHDIKAIEYWLRDKLNGQVNLELIHFGLTSDDVNNYVWNVQIMQANDEVCDEMYKFQDNLFYLINKSECVMMARTHGQPANITILSSELSVYLNRIRSFLYCLETSSLDVKLNGSVGNCSAFSLIKRKPNDLMNKLIKDVGKKLSISYDKTTQINNHDSEIILFNHLSHLCRILVGFCKDIWSYNSFGYFTLQPKEGEVGSSAMPQKVNPIGFESGEGLLEIAADMFNSMSRHLSETRMQRDLSDHAHVKLAPEAFGYMMLGLKYINKQLPLLTPNKEKMRSDIDAHPEIWSECVQHLLRLKSVPDSYNKIKEMTRGKKIELKDFENLLKEHKINFELKPENYLGFAEL